MTCSRCGRTLTDADPGHALHAAWGLYLCELCWDKSEALAPAENEGGNDAIHIDDDP